MVKLKEGELIIDLGELVRSLTEEQRLELVKMAAFEEATSDVIADLITEDISADGWWIGCSDGGPLHKARLKILEKMDKVERLAIKTMIHRVRLAEGNHKRYEDWAWAQHHWIRRGAKCPGCGHHCYWGAPELPKWAVTESVTQQDVDEVIAEGQQGESKAAVL